MAAEKYRRESFNAALKPNIDGPMLEYGGSIKAAFIAGANWQKEQMLKGAMEGFIFQSESYYPKELIAHYNGDLQMGDKVKIIIVKED